MKQKGHLGHRKCSIEGCNVIISSSHKINKSGLCRHHSARKNALTHNANKNNQSKFLTHYKLADKIKNVVRGSYA